MVANILNEFIQNIGQKSQKVPAQVNVSIPGPSGSKTIPPKVSTNPPLVDSGVNSFAKLNLRGSPSGSLSPSSPVTVVDGGGASKNPTPVKLDDVDEVAEAVFKPYYPQGTKPKGIALVINITIFDNRPDLTRPGASEDTKELQSTLAKLNYKVTECTDPTREILKKRIQKFESSKYDDADSFLLVLMSHGTDNDVIFTRENGDSGRISIWEDIVERFNNVNCEGLRGKPKIFLFNCCSILPQLRRTDKPYQSWTDMMVCFSGFQGCVSYGDRDGGNWFIQTFCQVLNKFAGSQDLNTMLQVVSELMKKQATKEHENRNQICPFFNIGFNKKFYFK